MAFYRRLTGIRASLPPGTVIGRKSAGRGAAEIISPGDIVRAGGSSAPASPGSGGTGVGTDGQVWATVGAAAAWSFLSLLTKVGTITSGVWNATKIALAFGGTNADLSATGGAHKFLRQNSVGAAVDVVQPDFSDLATVLGTYLVAGAGISLSGTTTVTITNTGSGGTVTHTAGGLTLHAPVVGNGSADLKTLAAMTDGQLMIGHTGADPDLATLTAGSNITITNAAGSITIAATGGGTGSVTSVAATVPTGLAVSGSPITTSGTLGFTWSGLIPLAQGGTHVDLTGTGPGYLKQASAGSSVTVAATIPYTDITGGPASSSYDVGDRGITPSVPGSRMFISQQLGATLPAAGGICGGPLCSGPMNSDTLEWIVPAQVDWYGTGAGPCLQWEGPTLNLFPGAGGRWISGGFNFGLSAIAANATRGVAVVGCMGVGQRAVFQGIRVNGSMAAPTGILSGDVLGRYTFWGSDDSGVAGSIQQSARLDVVATENWTTAAGGKVGTSISLNGVRNGTLSQVGAVVFNNAAGANPGTIVLGTNSTDNAPAGYYGEVVEADVQASPVNLTNNTNADITSISLTAGDWDVEGWVMFVPATGAPTQYKGWISTTSATDPGANNGGAYLNVIPVASVGNYGAPIGSKRLSLSATTTVYLSVRSLFPNTCTGQGHIKARRAR